MLVLFGIAFVDKYFANATRRLVNIFIAMHLYGNLRFQLLIKFIYLLHRSNVLLATGFTILFKFTPYSLCFESSKQVTLYM